MREPLVMIPGLMCDARVFGSQILTLSRDRVVSMALPTCGERVEEIASNLLGTLPERFALAGHALGGSVAMEIMRRAPDRVTRLALMSVTPLAETPQSAADYEPFIVKLRAGAMQDAVAAIIPPSCLAPGNGRPGVCDDIRAMAAHLGPQTIIAQLRAQQRRTDYQSMLGKTSVPVLVVGGRHDTLVPVKRLESMAGLIPESELVIAEEAGHLPTVEAPIEVTDALMNWLG